MVDTHEELMTIEDFIEQFDQQPFELIDGERLILSPTMYDHGSVQSNLLVALAAVVVPGNLGKLFTDTPFVLQYDSQWVKGSRVPDLMFYGAERLTEYHKSEPEYRAKPLVLVPDLVVEIVSPTDKFSAVSQKIQNYLRDGVRLVWVFDLARKVILVYQSGKSDVELSDDDLLTGGDVIPGFAITVSSLFE
jgi:Uma2 family endonuclease